MSNTKKKPKPVYSVRINEEILEAFKSECERMNVDPKYVISEYMKNFVVLNAERESFKKAIFFKEESMDFLEES